MEGAVVVASILGSERVPGALDGGLLVGPSLGVRGLAALIGRGAVGISGSNSSRPCVSIACLCIEEELAFSPAAVMVCGRSVERIGTAPSGTSTVVSWEGQTTIVDCWIGGILVDEESI